MARVYKLKLNGEAPWCVMQHAKDLVDTIGLEDLSAGTKVEIEILEMSQEDLDALPEFEGF